ncbi:MAG: hypothetical protein ABIH82_03420 [Candidatus Woesearchaeota archaeon]
MSNVKNILTLYDEKVLSPELGDGQLKTRLLDGLEQILRCSDLPEINDLADKPIDYEALFRLAEELGFSRGITERAKNILLALNVETYSDLAQAYHDNRRFNQDTFEKYMGSLKKSGPKTVTLLRIHLDSVGFDPKENYGPLTK